MAIRILTKQAILDEYVNKDVSQREACRVLGVCETTFTNALKFYGVEGKPRSWNKRRTNRFPQLQNREWLEEQLKTRTMLSIAKELGTSSGNVSDHVKRHGLRGKYYERSEAYRTGRLKAWPNGRYGENASNWKGGRTTGGAYGEYTYVFSPDHPSATKSGYVMEHRLVVEQSIGRFLTQDEIVHHINGDPTDNRLENLKLMSVSEHRELHLNAYKRVVELEKQVEELNDLVEELRSQ